ARTGARDSCTVGAGAGRHCVNGHCSGDGDCGGAIGACPTPPGKCSNGVQPAIACSNDANCGGAAGSCALDANCFFGPPLPIASPHPFEALTTCVVNIVQTAASGTSNKTTGDSSVSLPLSSRVYLTGNSASPCPRCLSGTCDSTWKTNTATTSPDQGAACTGVGSQITTNDCRANLTGF